MFRVPISYIHLSLILAGLIGLIYFWNPVITWKPNYSIFEKWSNNNKIHDRYIKHKVLIILVYTNLVLLLNITNISSR